VYQDEINTSGSMVAGRCFAVRTEVSLTASYKVPWVHKDIQLTLIALVPLLSASNQWRKQMNLSRIVVLKFAMFIALQSAAHGQTPLNADVFDVDGVKLGMSLGEATSALQGFDSHFVIAKLFATEAEPGFATLGAPDAAGKPTSYFTSLSAKDEGMEKPTYYHSTEIGDSIIRHDDFDEVDVFFKPSISEKEQRVIAVIRRKEFVKNPPLVTQVKTGIYGKYSATGEKTFSKDLSNGDYRLGWLFDVRHRLIPHAAAVRNHLITEDPDMFLPSGEFPQQVSLGQGAGVYIAVTARQDNPAIAGKLVMCLFDADALYRSINQSQEVFQTLDSTAKNAAAKQAAQHASQTKF